ncbi:MAG: adenylate/guanylate cyclase domain-containing protein [Actinomycetota bacterium]
MLICSTCGTENPDGAKFCNGCATLLGASASPGEVRKIVSALFCDLVGSTTLGEQHDPEVLRPILDGYFTEMSSAVERHGGLVQKFIGDAVVAVFGLPNAHEDDALRAVRAGIEMQERLQTLNEASPIPLAARIGITTGEVLVPGEKPIIGDAMNTASRLQSGAEPGQVLIGEPTWRLVRDAVFANEVEPLQAKGKAEPVSAWHVLEVHPVVAGSETPLVGRDRHLSVLHQALQDAIDDQACVLVTVLAPPGVGKSRLAVAFAEVVRDRATVLVGQTPSYGGVTFASLVELLSQAAGLPLGDAEQVAAALRERLVDQPDGASVGDRLAQVLGVGEALASDASWAVRRLLEVMAADRPLVVVLEDVHWAETPMLDLADAVIERVHGAVLFLCLARPELLEQRPTWAAGKPRAITMTLPPLMPTEARRVAELLLGGEAPAAVIDRVCETAEGNPLYLEQLTAMLADQGLLVDGRWVGSDDADVDIPETLQALLASRLDRLDPTPRLILERAAVEGRRFRIAAIRALTPDLGQEEFEAAIASLERRGLVQPEDEAAGRWRFAHALVLDAAYRGLSKELRADLHERIADWMTVEDADQADVDESVARHLEHALHLREELGARDERSAALAGRAGELFATAGSRAFTALDYITARDFLSRAAAHLPDGSPRRMEILPSLGAALADSGRAEESDALLTEAVDQAHATGSERDALRASVQLLSNRIYRSSDEAEIESASVEARRAFDVFEASGDEIGMAEAATVVINLEYVRAHCDEAQRWATRAMFRALAAGRPREATQAAGDLVGMALVGPVPFTRFAADAEELLTARDPISDSPGHALMAAAALAAGDEAGFREHEERWRDVVDRHGLAWLAAAHGMEIAFVELWAGRAEAAERRLREAQQFFTQIGNVWYMSVADEYLCEAVYAQDRPREFLRLADAFAASSLMTDRHNLVKRQVVLARAHLLRESAVEAEASARRALKLLESTDLIPDRVDALLVLADALDARGMGDEAATARLDSIAKLRAKGNLAAVALLER